MKRFLVVAVAMLAVLAFGTSPALAARADSQEGPNGAASAVINVSSGGQYRVDYAATDYSADNLYTETRLTIIDPQGSREIRDVNRGGDITDYQTFDNRGPVTVSIVFTFHRVFGGPESNAADPLIINYP